MSEIMVGEFSEFAEGNYRVLKVDSFEFGIFRPGRPLGRLREPLSARRRAGLPGQGHSARRGGTGGGPDQPRSALFQKAEHRLPLARLGVRHRIRAALRRSGIPRTDGRCAGAGQSGLREAAGRGVVDLARPHAEEPARAGVSKHEAARSWPPSFETRASQAPQDEADGSHASQIECPHPISN